MNDKYDDVGSVQKKDTEHGAYAYSYDKLDRLIRSDNPVLTDESFTYDQVWGTAILSGCVQRLAQNDFYYSPAFFFQSARNASIPLSVSGWAASCIRILYGTVAICAPARAASSTCMGLRMLAAIIRVSSP